MTPQQSIVLFALRNPGWHTYARDLTTVEALCAAVNLGILKINRNSQFALKSEARAEQFLKPLDRCKKCGSLNASIEHKPGCSGMTIKAYSAAQRVAEGIVS